MSAGPTIYDIAERAGVGIATVSRVLNGSSRVAVHTREAVQRAMSDLGFRPNRAARRLAGRSSIRPRVAALMPFFSASFYFSVSKALSEALQAADVDLSLHNVATRDEKNRLLDRLVADRSHDGLVLCTMGVGAERQEQLARARLPVVGVDFPIPGVATVTVDNVAGGEMAARHVVAGGAQRVAVLSGSDSVLAFRDRERGIANVVSDPPLARATEISSEAGAETCARLLDRHPRIDALICVNDVFAAGCLKVLRERGLDVPERVQVIGFDDQPLMDVLGLSTVHQPIGDFGGWAASAVLGLIKDPTAEPPPSVVLPLALVARATTRARAADRKRPSSRSTHHQEHP